jgi:carboxyl-terminal processing protease
MRRFILTICLVWGIAAAPALAEPRLALVIGNSDYRSLDLDHQLGVADAKLMAATLQELGFTVQRLDDPNRDAMHKAIDDFGRALFAAGSDATGVFYFSGLSLQNTAGQILLPKDADIPTASAALSEGIDVPMIVQQMKDSGCRTKIMILETDRFGRSGAADDLPLSIRDFFLANATGHGQMRAAAGGANNIFTLLLSKAMLARQGDIVSMARAVRLEVIAATDTMQVPTDVSTLTAPFSF